MVVWGSFNEIVAYVLYFCQKHKISDFADFQRYKIVGARLAEATVIKSLQLLDVSEGTVFKVMTENTKRGKAK